MWNSTHCKFAFMIKEKRHTPDGAFFLALSIFNPSINGFYTLRGPSFAEVDFPMNETTI